MERNRIIGLAALIALVLSAVAGIFLLHLFNDIAEERTRDVVTSEKDPTLLPDSGRDIPVIKDDPETALARYKRWAQYPPFSRPMSKGQFDRIHPYHAVRPPVIVIEKPAQDCDAGKHGAMRCRQHATFANILCQLHGERSISVGLKKFRLFLRCFSKNDGKNLPLDSIEAKTYRKLFREIHPSSPPAHVGDDGLGGDLKADDGIYTFTVEPKLKDWGYMFLEVSFNVGGYRHNQRATWYSTPHIVAEFQPGIADTLKDGHLVVSVRVKVKKAGYFKFDANLQEKEKEQRFIATSSWEGELPEGSQNIELIFWGKIIKDKGFNGPYIVREIRGRRNNTPVTPSMLKRALQNASEIGPQQYSEPPWEYVEPFPSHHETAFYRAKDFSPDEWNSEDKERRIRYLEGLIR